MNIHKRKMFGCVKCFSGIKSRKKRRKYGFCVFGTRCDVVLQIGNSDTLCVDEGRYTTKEPPDQIW